MCFISGPAAMPKIGSVYRLRLRGRDRTGRRVCGEDRYTRKRRTIVRRAVAKTTGCAARPDGFPSPRENMLRNCVAFLF